MINFFLKYKKLSLLLFLLLILSVSNYAGIISFPSIAIKTGLFAGNIFKWVSFAGRDIYSLPERYGENERRGLVSNRGKLDKAYYQSIMRENRRLRDLLKMPVMESLKPIGAKVLMSGIASYSRSIFIDRGIKDGVKEGFPVVVQDTIVGKVKKSGARTSLVYLLNHPDIAVDVTIADKNVRGIFSGGIVCTVKYVDVERDVSAGDIIYSSGMGGVYPEGFKVGIVEKVAGEKKSVFHSIEASPFIDSRNIDYVFVIPPAELDEIYNLTEEK